MKLAVEYSFRHQGITHEVIVPAELLLNVRLDVAVVRRLVDDDDEMLAELFRDHLPEYRLMAKDPQYWSEELTREDEMIRLVEVA